jgi:hypothetical protein
LSKDLLDAEKARFDGEKNVLVGKIEALDKMAASQPALIADLSKKSELAYEKVQDIANRAVTAARRERLHTSRSACRCCGQERQAGIGRAWRREMESGWWS